MRKKLRVLVWSVLVVLFLAAVGCWWLRNAAGFSARQEPSAVEAMVARNARMMAMPVEAKELRNPVSLTPEIMTEARRHFADHCAMCHANDGSGSAEMGQNLYPKAPDMRQSPTQALSDGEIYFIIHNGIRLSGMPAWGAEGDRDHDHESWALVYFIRHLPKLSPEEVREMEKFNPQSQADREEQREEEDFLNGKPAKK
ncbi:MAG TPA: c-type cytochrome [Verrucomicrobiae bacterium]|jgi:mono/diheme cytochrome c family protein|nr:c-type cytochrome [Verrucomicrobiae bacterium]